MCLFELLAALLLHEALEQYPTEGRGGDGERSKERRGEERRGEERKKLTRKPNLRSSGVISASWFIVVK